MTRSVFRATSLLLGVMALAACEADFDAEVDAVGTDEAGVSFATKAELERRAAEVGIDFVWSPPPAEACKDKEDDSPVGPGSFVFKGGDTTDCKFFDWGCLIDLMTWCLEDDGVIHCDADAEVCTCVTGTC
jgi:hypothetical protein